MPAAMDELVNRLAARLWQLASARITARVELEVARTQAELMEQAATFRKGHGRIGEQVAKRLEATSERLVRELLDEAGDVESMLDLTCAAPSNGAVDPLLQDATCDRDSTGKRPRGRPRKASASDILTKQPASEETFATNEKVTDEERTGARDPAGSDQVPDFSAEDDRR